MSDGTQPRPLLTISEAAQLLGISRAMAYKWAAEGVLPGVMTALPGQIRVNRAALQRFIDGDLGVTVGEKR